MERLRRKWRKTCDFVLGHDLALAAAIALLCIVVGLLVGWETTKTIPPNAHQLSRYSQEPGNPLRFLAGWDGPIYLNIAQHGYIETKAPAFFPLYPLSTRAAIWVTRSPLDGALLVAWASFVGAVCFYIKIVKRLFNIRQNREALRATLPSVLFPTAIFMMAPYTEALFGFLSLGALYFALHRRPLVAAVFTLFATATHANGVFILLLVAMVLYEEKARLRDVATGMVIGSLGLLAYLGFLAKRYHNPLQFVEVQRAHGWLHHTGYFQHLLSGIDLFSILMILLVTAAALYWWNRRRSLAVYAALYLCIPLIGGQISGFNRYALMAFPVPLMIYSSLRKSNTAYTVAVSLFAILWGCFMVQFAAGYIGG